jgi:hypothetical protein
VEFAFDSADAVTDAASYFPLFFHFDRALHMMKFSDHVHFHWELMGATFLMAKMAGFTVTITVNTGWYPSANEASIAWANGLGFLADYFVQVPPVQGAQLFNVV